MKRVPPIIRILVFIILTFHAVNSSGEKVLSADSIQRMFSVGKIISVNENIACYQLETSTAPTYGYCLYDSSYTPIYSDESHYWSPEDGIVTVKPNSKCYTIIAPVFNKALPFSEGWGAVCLGDKWSYVSSEGNFMCDFILDAAYPFHEGRANIIYNGQSYQIDASGNGLPSGISCETREMNRLLKGETVNQLFRENQFEKVIEKGVQLYNEIVHSEIDDVSSPELFSATKCQFAAMSAQSRLLAITEDNNHNAYDYYHGLTVEKRLSTESGLYALNRYNLNYYLPLFRYSHTSDSIVSKICSYAEDLNYKSAIILLEKWIKEKNVGPEDSPIVLLAYYYLAELSDDFETANQLLVNMSEVYEKDVLGWVNSFRLGHLLSDIKKYKSAEFILQDEINERDFEDNTEKEIICRYRLALLYASTNHIQESISQYEKAIELCHYDDLQPAMAEMKNEIMVEFIALLLKNGMFAGKWKKVLDDYVQSEIRFTCHVFNSEDKLHINRVWGKSQIRIQRLLQYLSQCNDIDYLKNVFWLVTLQSSIVNEAENHFLSGVKRTNNQEIKSLYSDYIALKRQTTGVNIFALDESDSVHSGAVEELSKIEREIKYLLQSEYTFDYESLISSSLNNLGKNDVVVSVILYDNGNLTSKVGALIIRGDLNHISFIPMGESIKDFWKEILNAAQLTPEDHCYLYAGKLDNIPFEYEEIDDTDIVYFKYNIHRIASMSKIKGNSENTTNNEIALFGGLSYGDEEIAQERGALNTGFLEHSKTEIYAISDMMKQKMSVSVFSDTKGTPEAFMKLCQHSPEIIHLATHGYQHGLQHKEWDSNTDRFNFFKQNTDVEDLDWLMNNTGLYMSSSEQDADNILSSREVASCNLSSTKLVVLSACSTLSGEVSDHYTESVGLTKSFAIAQAQNIITSLCDVDDQKTSEFMTLFYSRLKENDYVYDSFKNAVKDMKSKYPDRKDIWGAFVLLENH